MSDIGKIRKAVAAETNDDRLETFEVTKLAIERETKKTSELKSEFIKTVLNDYGDDLKSNPNSAQLITKSFWGKVKDGINKFFDII